MSQNTKSAEDAVRALNEDQVKEISAAVGLDVYQNHGYWGWTDGRDGSGAHYVSAATAERAGIADIFKAWREIEARPDDSIEAFVTSMRDDAAPAVRP